MSTEGYTSSTLGESSPDIDEIERLLDQAKENLSRPKLSDVDEEDEKDPNADLKEIRESWQNLPQLKDELKGAAKPIPKKAGVVKLVDDRGLSEKEWGVRRIVDPVEVKKQEKEQREATAGKNWFDMPKTEITPSIKRDLQLLQMRNVLDRKRHYKKDKSGPPKYFQTGTIIEGNTEYFSARMSKKERKRTLADEILADEASKRYFKRKYSEIQTAKTSGGKAHYKKIKQMRKKF
ncbi:rRNA-processing protein Fcf2p [Trichomonascus vanleenenianus]|uniref:Fcf2p n=1 Tax=Trichomonascus vanleenenianus TaxID=2268995 RepID=UPI003EC9D8C1